MLKRYCPGCRFGREHPLWLLFKQTGDSSGDTFPTDGDGRFIAGKIEGGEIRGGEFFDCEISKDVAKSITQENKNSPKPQQGQPQNRGQLQKVQGQTQPVQPQPVEERSPKIQPEKIEERVKRFDTFINDKRIRKI